MKDTKKPHPKDGAGFFSIITYAFILPLIGKAFRRDLRQKDMYEVPKFLEAKKCGDELEKAIKLKMDKGNKFSIFWVIISKYKFQLMLVIFPYMIGKFIRSIYQPVLISRFISYFKENQTHMSLEDVVYTNMGLMVMDFTYYTIFALYLLMCANFTVKMKVAVSSVIFKKVLKLQNAALTRMSVGNIVSLMTKDVSVLENGFRSLCDYIISTVQLVTTCAVLFIKTGPISFFGIFFMLIIMGLQVLIGKYITYVRVLINEKTADRIKATKEALASLKVIKMLSWEKFFLKKIYLLRRSEVSCMLKDAYAKSIIQILGSLCPDIMTYIFIISFIIMGIPLDVELVFYIINCVRSLKMSIIYLIPQCLGLLADFRGSLKRIDEILHEKDWEERNDQFVDKPKVLMKSLSVKIGNNYILSNVSINLEKGVTCIIGNNGSGKTTLLLSILREYPHKGHLITKGRISYASQEPWLYPCTVKENIIFGEEFDKKRYQNVINMCGLKDDLNNFQHGEDTNVINGGLNFSKGQQSRINLARAVYRDSEIYLLDDCLSSLDNSVQNGIVNNLLSFFSDKICLIVTNNSNLIARAHQVLIVDNKEVQRHHPDKLNMENIKDTVLTKEKDNLMINEDEDYKEIIDEKMELLQNNKQQEEETQKEGNVPFRYYLQYLKYGRGYFVFISIVILFILSQYAESYTTKTLTRWVDIEQTVLKENTTNNTNASEESTKTVQLYSGYLFLTIFLTILKIFIFYDFTKAACIRINKIMTLKILHSPLKFIDTQLFGNILNRFSQDLNNMDEVFPPQLMNLIRLVLSLASNIILVGMVNTLLLIPLIVLMILMVLMRKFYIPAARSLKRLETSSRSPFIGHINSTIDGLRTIRAHNLQNLQNEIFESCHNNYASSYYSFQMVFVAYCFYANMICLSLVFLVLWSFIFIITGISVGNVGLTIIQLFSISLSITMVFRQVTEVETSMTSFERIAEYTEQKQEYQDGIVNENWPKRNCIDFHNVSMSYNDRKVLNNVNLTIESNQKIGIIGRTGSGKSSLISLLMRLYDYEGTITIDHVDIKTIALEHLRRNIDVVPQDPILYSDTIRNNLDPLSQYADKEIWFVVDKLGIKHLIPNLYEKIDSTKYSAGQKQVICLARAMLRKSKILIMDEATAHVDFEMEKFMKNMISQHFSEHTIISISHKIYSISGYDKIFLIENGNIVEYKE
ncbi:unnamed protein product [Brassicogethes aeneus]|uniref:Uncharacterized protein n=1 Tax=Brassicogethes aeneus TaxID=1431903 RepID=A0A9P0B7T8_BRAAE|nr:unnamed protein product [Brassicogethes aeneus]